MPRLEKEVKGKKDGRGGARRGRARRRRCWSRATRCIAAGVAAGIELADVRELHLLTTKPFIYVFNVDEDGLADEDAARPSCAAWSPRPRRSSWTPRSSPSSPSSTREDAAELLAGIGQDEAGLDQLARVGFDTLGLQTYLTAGPKESRAWTIHQGWTAPQAAGVIHTDFQQGSSRPRSSPSTTW